MESGTVHQIIQAHKRILSGNNNNEGTSGGAVSSIVSFPWPFHHRLISIIICLWLNSWGSAAALGPAAQLTGSCGDGNGINRNEITAVFALSSQFSTESLFSVTADGEQQRRGTYFPQLYFIFSLRRSHHLLISVSPSLLFLLQHRRFAAAAQLLDSPWFSDERLNVYRHHSVSNCLFLFLSSFEVCVCAAAM